ncbi:MAG: dihydrolipoyl dehydrogenase [Candidatus Neomarinimicrobiota bacterium]|nr:dihydrolipoyl dehydrogenase [Candidatus Neomarinimicrobiota bacterium]|tara:strand:+ start:2045 stop:3424 length:1380 start_codon:yes stop_codon:yes gene_type:complete
MNQYDVIIIGGGPGGYVAGIRASQLGKKVLIIENNHLGGICANWGCIPTKSLLKNANVYDILKNASKYGIEIEKMSVNWEKVIKRSRDVVKRLSKGIEYLLKKNKIDYVVAKGKLLSENIVSAIDKDSQEMQYKGENVIIATGARAKYFPGMEPDGDKVLTYKEAMIQNQQPKSLVIIGAGAIGVEFAHFYNTFGTKVTLIEALPNILPAEDIDISKELHKIFSKRKIKIITNSIVDKIEKDDMVQIYLNSGDVIEAEKALIAVGVKGNIENIGLENCDVDIDKGWIKVNEFMQTSKTGVYAIGDVVGPPWLAHVASAEGVVAAEHLSGKNPNPMEYSNIPGCTYCHPEVASVGLKEQEALDAGYDIKVGHFPFRGLGKSAASGDLEGFVKIIYDAKYGEMLGCHIIGAEATNMITEAVIARKLETTYHEIMTAIHPHPTLSEAILEATADAYDEAIHI